MKMPAEAREAFDALLVLPLGNTRALKKRFAVRATALSDTAVKDQSELMDRVVQTT